jgi:hypothetical protein
MRAHLGSCSSSPCRSTRQRLPGRGALPRCFGSEGATRCGPLGHWRPGPTGVSALAAPVCVPAMAHCLLEAAVVAAGVFSVHSAAVDLRQAYRLSTGFPLGVDELDPHAVDVDFGVAFQVGLENRARKLLGKRRFDTAFRQADAREQSARVGDNDGRLGFLGLDDAFRPVAARIRLVADVLGATSRTGQQNRVQLIARQAEVLGPHAAAAPGLVSS